MNTDESSQRSLSFGEEAAAYERGRPSYPPEAIDWLLPVGARDVLDLGAGTGKLTVRLVERGLDVIAVELELDAFADVRLLQSGDTEVLDGTANGVPLRIKDALAGTDNDLGSDHDRIY